MFVEKKIQLFIHIVVAAKVTGEVDHSGGVERGLATFPGNSWHFPGQKKESGKERGVRT